MYRRRLRDTPSDDELAYLYAEPHDHRRFGAGHHLRVEHTVVLGSWLRDEYNLHSLADLSTGNGIVPIRINGPTPKSPGVVSYLGDYAPGYQYQGPIEETIWQIPEVDLFICSETIEHLDDPDDVLAKIADKAHYLLLSTPIGEDDEGNPEHVWGWDVEAVEVMLDGAGFDPLVQTHVLIPDSYSYQLHTARSRRFD